MTLSDVFTMLNSIDGFSGKVAYRAFPIGNAPALPYIAYLCDYSNNFGADNVVYVPIKHIRIELYSEQKDEASEAKVEAALTANGLFYEITDEDYIDTEQMYEVVYEIEFVGGADVPANVQKSTRRKSK